jgi:hypothetical protein
VSADRHVGKVPARFGTGFIDAAKIALEEYAAFARTPQDSAARRLWIVNGVKVHHRVRRIAEVGGDFLDLLTANGND